MPAFRQTARHYYNGVSGSRKSLHAKKIRAVPDMFRRGRKIYITRAGLQATGKAALTPRCGRTVILL